jgi:lipopolysaccharide/colanic/teichoic acid biosynthesis glycosyltransferase
MDVVAASMSLLLLAVPAGLAWLLLRATGPATVTFVAEERLGANRRHMDRRVEDQRVGIDRRDQQRRKLMLPGRTFVTYRMVVRRPSANAIQRALARWIEASRLDRLPYLWNVLRGDMSLVGPSVHLLESDTWKQTEINAWCFARRPGLTGPAQILGDSEEAPLYDSYYSRHANWRLDLDALRHSLPRLFHRVTNGKAPDEAERSRPGLRLPQSSTGKGGIP